MGSWNCVQCGESSPGAPPSDWKHDEIDLCEYCLLREVVIQVLASFDNSISVELALGDHPVRDRTRKLLQLLDDSKDVGTRHALDLRGTLTKLLWE